MPIDFAVPYIDGALGHSIIDEEYRGDLDRARQVADTALAEARRQDDARALADALLARGLAHLLQGEPVAARDCFGQVEALVPGDAARCLRALGYAYYATCRQFNLLPNGSGASALEAQARFNLVDAFARAEQRWLPLFNQVSDAGVQLEAALVWNVLCNLMPLRTTLDLGYVAQPDEREAHFQLAVRPIGVFYQWAKGLDAPAPLLAFSLRAAADFCRRAGKLPAALDGLGQSGTLSAQAGDAAGVGAYWMTAGDWQCAPFSTPLVWNHVMSDGNWSNELSPAREAAELDRRSIDVSEARRQYAEAGKAYRAGNAVRGLAALELRYDYLSMLEGDYAQVVEHAARAQELFAASGDQLGAWLARTHRALGLIGTDARTQDTQTAEAIGAWGKDSGSFSYALGLGLLCAREGRRWLVREGDHERALACFDMAQILFEHLDAPDCAAQCLGDQGTAHALLNNLAEATNAFERALDAFCALSSRAGMRTAAWQKAVLVADQICQIHQDRQDADDLERSTTRLRALFAQPPPGDGTDLFGANFSDTLKNSVGQRLEFASVFVPLSRAIRALETGREGEAQVAFNAALEATATTSAEQREFLAAVVLRTWRRYADAEAAFQRYLDQGGAASGFAADLAQRMALAYGPAGEALWQQRPQQTQIFAAMFFTRAQAYARAKGYLDRLEQQYGGEWWASDADAWQTLSNYGEVYEGLGQLAQADGYYDRAMSLWEARRYRLTRDESKLSLAGAITARSLYFYAARNAIRLHRQAREQGDAAGARDFAARAVNYAERGRARALLDLMASSRAIRSSRESDAMREWRQLNAQLMLRRSLLAHERSREGADANRIGELSQSIDADEQRLRQVEERLSQANPNFYQAVSAEAPPIALDALTGGLPANAALLQYAFLDDTLLAWAITHEGMGQSHIASADARQLAWQIRSYQRACQTEADTTLLAARLAGQLLVPLAETIRQHTRLLIVPYGAAHLLPFHALPFDDQPLAATHAISYLPSASARQFLAAADKPLQTQQMLAVGNPGGDLPFAATEATYVAALYGRRALLGPDATEERVRAELAHSSLLHFATHGRLSEDAPLSSSIVLAGVGELSVYELMGLQLNAELVVLSACQTGLGETTGGDDVLGLTRGLLGAGAQAAVVSLWPVDDISTSLFMGEFYRQTRAGVAPAPALQQAQRYLREMTPGAKAAELDRLKAGLAVAGADALQPASESRAERHLRSGDLPRRPDDYHHPYYWAPFILVG